MADINENTSDGYHTFKELYEHRMALFLALARSHPGLAWKSKRHSDGDLAFGGGWFVCGLQLPTGQVTYHYDLKHWDLFEDVKEYFKAPKYDGHEPKDVVERLLNWKP